MSVGPKGEWDESERMGTGWGGDRTGLYFNRRYLEVNFFEVLVANRYTPSVISQKSWRGALVFTWASAMI